MKSLYFQTVGIECKFYENQQLEYRLYSWGERVRKIISANCDAHLAESLFQTRSKAFQIAIFLFTLYFVCDMMFQSGLYNCR